MRFKNFYKFTPYLSLNEMNELYQLYETIQSSNTPIVIKTRCYNRYSQIIETLKIRIKHNEKIFVQNPSNNIVPIWYNKGK